MCYVVTDQAYVGWVGLGLILGAKRRDFCDTGANGTLHNVHYDANCNGHLQTGTWYPPQIKGLVV